MQEVGIDTSLTHLKGALKIKWDQARQIGGIGVKLKQR